jgi:DNA-directed RNA polymerase I subunit RPA1
MDQAYRLLRSQCAYCHRFLMARREIHRYSCMLRLLQVGLLHEAQMIDSFDESDLGEQLRGMTLSDVPTMLEDEAQEEGNTVQDSISRSREAYVRAVLQKHRHDINMGTIKKGKHEGAAEMRRTLIKEFLGKIVMEKKCRTCDGIAPKYRKDRYVKIFEKEMSLKDKAQMAQAGRRRANALALSRKVKKDDYAQDEGIADIDLDSNGEEPESEGDGEELDENGDVVMGEAAAKPKEKKQKAPPRAQRYLSPLEVKERLNLLFEKEQEIMSLLYNSKPRGRKAKPVDATMFFIQTLMVPPNRYRPEVRGA